LAISFAQEKPSVVPLSSSNFVSLRGLPTCVTETIQHGDPSNGAAVLAARLTAGCTIPWHWHSQNGNLIMIRGKDKTERTG
jgi:hypothetical protein